MRVNINLASRKFEDVRRFFVGWSVSLTLLAALTIVLAALAWLKFSSSTRTERESRDLQAKIAALQRERNELMAFENRPENREVTQQKQFWNMQIMRRSFSWTLLFNDLQKIMPTRAYVDSVQPELTPEGRLKLRLMITGETQDDAIDLIKRMESSSRFHSPRPISVSTQRKDTSQKNPASMVKASFQFEIETYYTPAYTPPAAPSTKTGAKEGM